MHRDAGQHNEKGEYEDDQPDEGRQAGVARRTGAGARRRLHDGRPPTHGLREPGRRHRLVGGPFRGAVRSRCPCGLEIVARNVHGSGTGR